MIKFSLALLACLAFLVLGGSQPELTTIPTTPTAVATLTNVPTRTASPTPTLTPFPTQTPIPLNDLYQFNSELITDPELAIAYSHNLLILRGYEKGFSYDNALYIPIVFPDGAKGAFVALGFSGITRGYKLLYRTEKLNTFRLLQLEESDYDWGMDFGDNSENSKWTKAPLKFPELLYDASGTQERLIELTGSSYNGSFLWENGYFEIIRVTNSEIVVLFSGTRFEGNMPEFSEFKYNYEDLDGDGNKEIIKTGQECEMTDNASFDSATCLPIRKIYKYDGEVFTEQP